jgi:hypothetical protein
MKPNEMNVQRSLLTLLWFLLTMGLPAAGQAPGDVYALLVLVPDRMALDDREVERWMDLLKIERDRQRLTPEELPLLRLSLGRAQHRAALSKLGLASADQVRTFTCRRDQGGWPSEILTEHEPGTSPDQILARVVKQKNAPEAQGATVLGLLLVADESPLIQPFLEELGRFWLQRYGRVRPSPYPLASYDIGQAETAKALDRAFPELTNGQYPLVALCAFTEGQPVQVLKVFRGLDTPASLVREISAARGQALAGATSAPAVSTRQAPTLGADPIGLTSDQERLLLVSRLNETAQQLWNDSKNDKSERNQGPKRILLSVIEDSRRFLAGDQAALGLLMESLRDYAVEPLRLNRASQGSEQSARFLELGKTLLDSH